MASRPRTKGDTCDIYTAKESVRGTAVKTTAHGRLKTLSDKTKDTYDSYINCGSRANTFFEVSRETGYSATMTVRTGDLSEWLAYGYSTAETLPSITTEVKVGPGEWHLWDGGVVDTLTISASQIGSPIQLTADVVARWHTFKKSGQAYSNPDGTAYTDPGTPVAGTNSLPVRYNSLPVVDGASLNAKSWTLTVSNSIVSDAGVVLGKCLASGCDAYPSDLDITLSMTISSATETAWDKKRQDGASVTVKIVLDGKTLTVAGIIDAQDPDRQSESGYDETITLNHCSLKVE